jgi:hypothetical protein
MVETKGLRITNAIIYALSLLGSLIITFVGLFRGQCIDSCDSDYYAEYIANPSLIAFGVAGFLVSTLTFQVINIFALHVEKSHKA